MTASTFLLGPGTGRRTPAGRGRRAEPQTTRHFLLFLNLTVLHKERVYFKHKTPPPEHIGALRINTVKYGTFIVVLYSFSYMYIKDSFF